MLNRIRKALRGPYEINARGFFSWEMILVFGLVLGVIGFALFMLRKSYTACTNEGYSLLECVFNSPSEDPYDTKEKAAELTQKTKSVPARRSALN
mgnify:CR=1 FL=1